MRNFETPSRTSPTSSRRGCLCKNGKYSTKCCNGTLHAQGIGDEQARYDLRNEDGSAILQENGFEILI